MHEKLNKRVEMNEFIDPRGKIEDAFLRSSPKHEGGHPYQLDKETYDDPISIAKDLTDQIASSKPKDNM